MFNFNQPVKMCSRRSCCPTIEFSEDEEYAIIKDDFGGSVKLLFEEMDILVTIMKNFKERDNE